MAGRTKTTHMIGESGFGPIGASYEVPDYSPNDADREWIDR
jgi:hypothetical protein